MSDELPEELRENMKKSGDELPEAFRDHVGYANPGFRQNHGESQAFKDRKQAPLHPACKIRAVKRWLETRYPELDMQTIDIESHVTAEERTSEVIEAIRDEYNLSRNREKVMNEEMVRNDLEKYAYQWTKFIEEHTARGGDAL